MGYNGRPASSVSGWSSYDFQSYLTDKHPEWNRVQQEMETCEAAHAARGASSGCLWQLCSPGLGMNKIADLVQVQRISESIC